jgi:hypothetical protein
LKRLAKILVTIGSLLPAAAMAQTGTPNLYGMPGLLDMPSATSAPDAQFSTTVSSFAGQTRTTMSFQITPRLIGSFRYTGIASCNCFGFSTYYDRSFDLHYQINDEGRFMPAFAVGLRDFVGTGIYSGEYVVATKQLTPSLRVTGGLGWGRLGSYNSFTNPLSIFGASFNTRPTGFGLGGVPGFKQWFRGPAALFAGVEWQTPVRGLTFKAEYSSDAYTFETGAPNLFSRRLPINLGLDYRLNESISFGGYYMYGSELGLRATISLNPKHPPFAGSIEAAPTPVFARPRDGEPGYEAIADTSWTAQSDGKTLLVENLQTVLSEQGLVVESMAITGTRAEVRFRNKKYNATPQAIGRMARMMTRIMPLSVETFVLTPVVNGIPAVSVTVLRSDLETLENDPQGTEKLLARAKITAPGAMVGDVVRATGVYPTKRWSLGPYMKPSLFDPDNPVRADFGVRGKLSYDIAPGLSVSGSVTQKLVGNLNSVTRVSNSLLPHVRSDFNFYDIQGSTAIEYLTADYFFKLRPNIYGRVSVGYLEQMYGGISTELLWKPVNSRLALGAELNLVRQRAFNQKFGFQSYQIATGHVSAYLSMRNGFSAQVDVGRYLAGDWGATFILDREFANGWKIGGFFTLTNVPFATFGEGSFDKGLRLTIPLAWITGQPSLKSSTSVIRPVTRDGGAQLKIRNRLYPMVSGYHRDRMAPNWARFWR